jgi:hypothetical protein
MISFKYLINRFFYRYKKYGFIDSLSKTLNFFTNKNKINLDELKIDKELSLDDIFLTFGTDKGYLDGKKTYDYLKKDNKLKFKNYFEWICRKNIHDYDYALGANYTPYYLKYLEKLRKENLKILEIGVANGHSLASFYKYFYNARLFGIDIKDPNKVFYCGKRMFYKQVDIMNHKQVANYLKKYNSFDIIIDDSLHRYEGNTTNLKNFFPALKSNGTYILEDYNGSDEARKKITDWNFKNNRKPMIYGYNTFEDVLKYLIKKKNFACTVLSNQIQKYLMENISVYNSYRTEHPGGSIVFIKKINKN